MGSQRDGHDWVTFTFNSLHLHFPKCVTSLISLSFTTVTQTCYCLIMMFSSVQFSRSVVSDSLQPHESQHARPPCPSPTPRVYSDSRPLSRWCHPAISSSVVPFSSCPNPSQHQSLFQWVSSSHQVAKVLEFQLQHQSFQWTPRTDLLQNGLVGSPCSPRDPQDSSPTPQFKSTNSSELSFLYDGPLTFIHEN